MTVSQKAIEITELSMYYGSIRGIDQVSFSVDKGSVHGFLGPNGAGKTTTIRILVGIMKQTAGKATIFGNPVGSNEAKQMIGYLPSDFELYKQYTVGEYLHYIATLRGGAPLLDELVANFDVDLSRKTRELSKGNRQKVSIVQAFMNDPDIIIADEPTSGLDPLMQAVFDETISKLAKRGKTILISSHILTEVQSLCDDVTVIKAGNVISSGQIEQMLNQIPKKAIIKYSNGYSPDQIAADLDAVVANSSKGKVVLYFNYSTKEFARRLSNMISIDDFIIPEPNLEEYFLPLYQKQGL